MKRREWTLAQKKAISARGEQILVSAAAGSGKTAVLTERVKNILCDPSDPCSVSQILVVTFTRAAAGEMRERIASLLREELNSGHGGAYLRRQLLLLPTADICTIDSFCAKLVREHFHSAGVSPDFRMLDDGETEVLECDAAEKTMEYLYNEKPAGFETLNRLFLTERDDKKLAEVIRKLYHYSRAVPDPERWLKRCAFLFSPEAEKSDWSWVNTCFSFILPMLTYHDNNLLRAVQKLKEADCFEKDYVAAYEKTQKNINSLIEAARSGDWDAFVKALHGEIIVKYRSYKRDVDVEVREFAKKVIDDCQTDVDSLLKKSFPDSVQNQADCKILHPAVSCLTAAVGMFEGYLKAEKEERNAYSFDDILHFCIGLLTVKNGDSIFPSLLAEELSGHYREIMIDEYQDTNAAQDLVFQMISKEKTNLYCVGDVKQSIYGFRLADPSLFLKLRASLPDYTAEKAIPSQITLEKNFRSRRGITACVNFVFGFLMSKEFGDLDYDERESLYYGAEYPETKEAETEYHLLLCPETDTSRERTKLEAAHVAENIRDLVAKGFEVRDGNGMRRARYGDFCILLRSPKNKAALYAEALKELAIEASIGTEEAMENSREIAFLISLLRVLDNPLLDVPLTAVMLSPVFGFSPDDLAEIRMIDRSAETFACLEAYAKTNAKAAAFLEKLQLYRNISAVCPIGELVRSLTEDTAAAEIFSACGSAELRRANLRSFEQLADRFCDQGGRGLGSFLHFLDRLIEAGSLKSASVSADSPDAVKIMSIHKSKGLEFSVVILADCAKEFNRRDSYGALTVNRETYLGLKIRDDDLCTQYHTLSSAASEFEIQKKEISEELRVLYVALTRAKEKLILVSTLKDTKLFEETVFGAEKAQNGTIQISPYAVFQSKSYAQWFALALSFHADCKKLREFANLPDTLCVPSDFHIKTVVKVLTNEGEESAENDAKETETAEEPALPDASLVELLRQRAAYRYPYGELSGVLAKRTASSAEEKGSTYLCNFNEPHFMNRSLSGAQRGTAIHKFLELCDLKGAQRNSSSEVARLTEENLLTNEEADSIQLALLKKLFESELFGRLLHSARVAREYQFSVMRSAGTLYPELSQSLQKEQILVQGVIDCAFWEENKVILIDYKTDHVSDPYELWQRYKNQLAIYKSALEECEGVTVSEVYLYSFHFGFFIDGKEA